jgi:membrane protein DedA with SNARE-associated domain
MYRIIEFLRKHFGRKEWLALGGSIAILIAAVWFSSRISDFEEFGYVGGFLAMLLGSATLILPAPGLAVVAGLGSVVPSPLLLGIVAGIGATIGETTGYLAGYGSHKLAEDEKGYTRLSGFIEKYGFWAIFILAFIPNPLFDIAGLLAGGTKYPIKLFLIATLIGKIAKCILAAYAGAWSLDWFA